MSARERVLAKMGGEFDRSVRIEKPKVASCAPMPQPQPQKEKSEKTGDLRVTDAGAQSIVHNTIAFTAEGAADTAVHNGKVAINTQKETELCRVEHGEANSAARSASSESRDQEIETAAAAVSVGTLTTQELPDASKTNERRSELLQLLDKAVCAATPAKWAAVPVDQWKVVTECVLKSL